MLILWVLAVIVVKFSWSRFSCCIIYLLQLFRYSSRVGKELIFSSQISTPLYAHVVPSVMSDSLSFYVYTVCNTIKISFLLIENYTSVSSYCFCLSLCTFLVVSFVSMVFSKRKLLLSFPVFVIIAILWSMLNMTRQTPNDTYFT